MHSKVPYTLRPVSPADADALHLACWPGWPVESIAELLSRVDRLGRQGRGFGLIAISPDMGVLGYGQLTVWPRTTEISDLIVTPAHRGQRIGTTIISALVDKVRALGLTQVEIGVARSNPRALRLYRRLGFQEDRTIELDLGHGLEPVIYLTMQLDS